MSRKYIILIISLLIAAAIIPESVSAQSENKVLDEKVKKFLSDHSGQWHDLNVPRSDGELLYNLVIKGKYRSALEIGTVGRCFTTHNISDRGGRGQRGGGSGSYLEYVRSLNNYETTLNTEGGGLLKSYKKAH